MATFTRLNSGSWRAQVRRKGRYVSETFLRREDARQWATDAERRIDRGGTPLPSRIARLSTLEDLIDLHITALALIDAQRPTGGAKEDRIFPYNHRSAGTAFRRACQDLGIEDLAFTTYATRARVACSSQVSQQVALVTGHTHLKPESLHAVAAAWQRETS
jgi:hypothetical protein